jgi:uncharacterized protein involved in exopolysaccharide biosynthesis
MEEYVSFHDFTEFAKRHRSRMIKAAAGSVFVVMLGTLLMTPVYEAESLLLVKFGREYMYRPELGERDAIAMGSNKDRQLAQINTEIAILRSRELAADVLSDMGTDRLYPDLRQEAGPGAVISPVATNRLMSNVSAYNVKDSDVIRVKFQHSDAKLAAQALNVLVDKFVLKHLNAFSDAQSTAFLEQKVANSRKELQQAEEKLKAFQQRTRAFAGDAQVTALLAQRDELEA